MDSINEDGPIGRQRKSQNVETDPFDTYKSVPTDYNPKK